VTLTRRRLAALAAGIAALAALVAVLAVVGLLLGVSRYQRQRLPDGYTLWHDLPLPDYFTVLSEAPSRRPDATDPNAPRVCTEGHIRQNLRDPTPVREETLRVWQRRGFRVEAARQTLNPTTRYHLARPRGGTLDVLWSDNPGGGGFFGDLLIWDCP
jgi:hypothetical protein